MHYVRSRSRSSLLFVHLSSCKKTNTHCFSSASGLDGILGLSFLDQFACVDFDFVNDELRLDKTNPNPLISNMNDIVAQGPLSLTKLRIYISLTLHLMDVAQSSC